MYLLLSLQLYQMVCHCQVSKVMAEDTHCDSSDCWLCCAFVCTYLLNKCNYAYVYTCECSTCRCVLVVEVSKHDSSVQEVRSDCLVLEMLALMDLSCLLLEPRPENGNVRSEGQAKGDNSTYIQIII